MRLAEMHFNRRYGKVSKFSQPLGLSVAIKDRGRFVITAVNDSNPDRVLVRCTKFQQEWRQSRIQSAIGNARMGMPIEHVYYAWEYVLSLLLVDAR